MYMCSVTSISHEKNKIMKFLSDREHIQLADMRVPTLKQADILFLITRSLSTLIW